MTRIVAVAAALLTLLAVAASPAAATRYVAGSDGSGDPFFPLAGNGGYDVKHYWLNIDYDHVSDALEGATVIRARATQNLYRSTSTCATLSRCRGSR